MSIRVKLIISYVLMTIIPIGLFVLFLHLLFHLFINNIEELKAYYQVDEQTVETFFYEELASITELKQVARTSPDRLLAEGYFESYEQLLDHRQIGIVVQRDNQIVAGTSLDDQQLLAQLPAHQLSPTQDAVDYQGQLGEDTLYTGTDFYFNDGSAGSLFITLDIEPVNRFLTGVIPWVITGFVVVFIATNALITYILSKHLIQPLKKLHQSAGEIAEGNLEQETMIVRNDEIGDLANAFEEMRLKLKDSIAIQERYERNRKELINNISHDLKTPITSIKGHVQGIVDGVAHDQQKLEKYVRIIHTKATEMDTLIDELLLFSKLDLNSIPFQFEHVEVSSYLTDIIDSFNQEHSDVAIHADLQVSPDAHVLADRAQLYKVFSNIVTNSVKFMRQEDKTMTISASASESLLAIAIKDNGQGIEPQDLPYVFDRFYRAESARGSVQGGSGIGLAIVKQLVLAHKGTVTIESQINQGTTVHITLPLVNEQVEGGQDEANLNH